MEGIILAGGFGTRLRDVVPNLPKPMAPIQGRPFLAYLLDYLEAQGFKRVILATGYKHEAIFEYFGTQYHGIRIGYSREVEPLGTGGALKKALELITRERVFMFNGDTFFQIKLAEMERYHQETMSHITIALKKVEKTERYGLVQTSNDRIIGFYEKKAGGSGFINGGIYCLNSNIFADVVTVEKFSWETDFLNKHCRRLKFQAFVCDSYFIDIGIPEDYARAERELSEYTLKSKLDNEQ